MSLSFPVLGFWDVEWGRPLVCAGRPRPAVLSKDQASAEPNWAGQGPAADEGVRPTTFAVARLSEIYVALGFQPAMPRFVGAFFRRTSQSGGRPTPRNTLTLLQ